ncbi:MAG TPA: hypothetical protein ENK67_07355 [Flavobacteriia bacterium]|nr:hypothetical protein [Flavobacteriia bacterium]
MYKVNTQFLKVFAVSLFIWNFSYGLLANNLLKFYNDEVLVDFITEHQKDVFLVSEHTIINQYTYKTGKKDVEFIKTKKYFNTIEDLKKAYPNKKYIYTDIIQKPQVFNRASFILQNTKLDFYNNRKELIKTYKGLYGKSYIYKVYF